MQAISFQESNEKIQHSMVGVFVPDNYTGFGCHTIRTGGQLYGRSCHSPFPIGLVCFGHIWSAAFHCFSPQIALVRRRSHSSLNRRRRPRYSLSSLFICQIVYYLSLYCFPSKLSQNIGIYMEITL